MNGASAGRLDWNIIIFAVIVTGAALFVAVVIAILVVVGAGVWRRICDHDDQEEGL